MKLKPIKAPDSDQWRILRKALYQDLSEDFNQTEMKNILASRNWHCFLIQHEAKNIGLVEVSLRNIVDGCLSSPVPYLEGIYLEPAARDKGLGKIVMEHLMNWCTAKGHSELAADCEIANPAAQRFFQSLGFSETYRTVGFRIDL